MIVARVRARRERSRAFPTDRRGKVSLSPFTRPTDSFDKGFIKELKEREFPKIRTPDEVGAQ